MIETTNQDLFLGVSTIEKRQPERIFYRVA
jgi:hypothetical protein